MPLSVLRLLAHDQFRSGEDISRQLGISRASVHNLLARARALGVEIHAVRGQGYRLAAPYTWLDSDSLARRGRRAGYDIRFHERLDSTNNHLLGLAQQGGLHKSVAVAELQTSGRGRRGREWLSPLGGGLTFSLLWRFRRPLTGLSGLSLAVGVALARALRNLGVTAAVKWPNDILIHDQKLAGILIETQGDMLSAAAAVIGVGINVRANAVMRSRVDLPLVSLADVLDSVPDRNALLLSLLETLNGALQTFDADGFKPFAAEWQELHAWQGRPVSVSGVGREVLEGIAEGVDETGALLVGTQTGTRPVHSGEVRLRVGERP